MAECYYKTFDVFVIESDGSRTMLPGENFDVANISQGSYLDTLTTNADGMIDEGYFSSDVAPGDIIEFTHLTYPGVFRLTLTATREEAYTHTDNFRLGFVVENNLTGETPSDNADLFYTDPAQPDLPPQFLGKVRAGETTIIPYRSKQAQDLNLFVVSQSQKRQLTTTVPTLAESATVSIPASDETRIIRPLFDHFTDVASTGSGGETLFTTTIPSGTLSTDKDKITFAFSGTLGMSGFDKAFYLNFAGADFFFSGSSIELGSTSVVESWRLAGDIIRVDSTTIRCNAVLSCYLRATSQGQTWTGYAEVAGDCDSDQIFSLNVETLASDDIILSMGHGLFIPAAEESDFLIIGSDSLTVVSDPLTLGS